MEYGRYPNKLKMYRKRSGYTRKKAARLLGYSNTSMLSLFENGHALPGIVQTIRLSQLYHALPHELFDELWDECRYTNSLSLTDKDDEDYEVEIEHR